MKAVLIGDIHFGKLCTTEELAIPGEPISDKTKGAVSLKVSFVENLKKEHVDYLLVVGDLTSTGSPIEYSRCITEMYNIASAAKINPNNVIFGVGNHDVDRKISKLGEADPKVNSDYPFSESERLYQNLAASHGELLASHLEFQEKGPAPFSGVILRDDIIVFVLNSSWFCSHDPSTKHGKLDKGQIEWYEEKVVSYSKDPRWKIVLLHHHPFNYPYPTLSRDISLLDEGAELVDISGKAGINIICHGHRHHPKAHNEQHDDWKNAITFICSGSFSVNAAHRQYGRIPNVYHLLELEEDAGRKTITMHSYEYSISSGWEPIRTNCHETPLDPVMIFEKPYDEVTRLSVIKQVLDDAVINANGIPFILLPIWDDLPIELKTLRFKSLNELVKDFAEHEYQIIGLYPDRIALLRRS